MKRMRLAGIVTLCALIPLPENAPFRDAHTGNLAVWWAILLCGALVVVYTVAGGLWAVLMTDVLQFIVLTAGVLFVVPLSVARVGGLGTFRASAPDGFFQPTTGEYTWWFLIGWVAIQFLSVGGEWAFVQRYLCVPTPADARRGTYLFGILYIVSPVVWMLPPMLYRVSNPGVDHEQAYILACRDVLPAGMVGFPRSPRAGSTTRPWSSSNGRFSSGRSSGSGRTGRTVFCSSAKRTVSGSRTTPSLSRSRTRIAGWPGAPGPPS